MSPVAVLGYHRIGPPVPGGWESWFTIPEAVFADHLRALREGGWEVLDAEAFLSGLAEPERLPERAALITFDDGYRSIREAALRCLRAFDYPAVLFIPAEFVGRTNEFDRDNEPEEPLCDWSDLRELSGFGISIQSHGASHRSFSELSPEERRGEVERSKAVLEGGLEESVDLLAFPYGDDAEAADGLHAALEGAGYGAAFRYGGDPFTPPVLDPYRIPRVAMGPDTDLRTVLAEAADGR
jgi:peptidoglycan/xylan/chitin deacetylase (PgdA/CDA1 family)